MILTYWFGKYGDDEFDYEVDEKDFIKNGCTVEELMEYAKELYDNVFDDELKAEYKEEFGINSSEDLTLNTDAISDIVSNCDEDDFKEYFSDQLHDYFMEDAYDAYNDAVAFLKDSLGYYGMSEKDFY